MGEFLENHQYIFEDLADQAKVDEQVAQLLKGHTGYEDEKKRPKFIKI